MKVNSGEPLYRLELKASLRLIVAFAGTAIGRSEHTCQALHNHKIVFEPSNANDTLGLREPDRPLLS